MLAGTETNILPDGSLDYADELLQRLDWVIGSIHTSFGMDEAAMTERMIAAINHPWLDAIGHPTGRKIETRPPYAIDMARVIEAAAANGTMIEINSAPDRRDMNDVYARAAAAAGVMILIDSDAHGAETLGEPQVRRRDRAARVADGRSGGQHAAVAGVREAAQARARAPEPRPGRRRRRERRDRLPASLAGRAGRRARCGCRAPSPTRRGSRARASGSAAYGPGASLVTSRQPSASASSWAIP